MSEDMKEKYIFKVLCVGECTHRPAWVVSCARANVQMSMLWREEQISIWYII